MKTELVYTLYYPALTLFTLTGCSKTATKWQMQEKASTSAQANQPRPWDKLEAWGKLNDPMIKKMVIDRCDSESLKSLYDTDSQSSIYVAERIQKERWTLFSAIERGDKHMAYLLLKMDQDIVIQPDNNGNTPLLLAARDNHLNIVKLFLGLLKSRRSEHNLNQLETINQADGNHETPLDYAMLNNNLKMVKQLLPEIHQLDGERLCQLLDWAMRCNKYESLEVSNLLNYVVNQLNAIPMWMLTELLDTALGYNYPAIARRILDHVENKINGFSEH